MHTDSFSKLTLRSIGINCEGSKNSRGAQNTKRKIAKMSVKHYKNLSMK